MTETIAVVGVGEMGRHAVSLLLAARPDITVRAFDRSAEALERLGEDEESDRIVFRHVDSSDAHGIDLTSCRMVLSFAGPFYSAGPEVAQAALRHDCDYVDICDDVEGTETLLRMDSAAKENGRTVVTGAGLSPGLTNIAARYLLDRHPDCTELDVAWATREPNPGGLAPLRHMLHMAVTGSPQFRKGAVTRTAGFVPSTARSYPFPAPVGEIECFDTAHPEPILLSRAFPGLSEVNCQGAMLPAWANQVFSSLARLGFGDPDLKVAVGDIEIDPQEFLWRLLWARHGSRRPEAEGIGAFQVAAGRDRKAVARVTMVDDAAMARSTSLGAVAVALSVMEQSIPSGVHGPEALDAERTLEEVDRLRALTGAFPEGFLYETLEGDR